MNNPFGYPDKQWAEAALEATRVLEKTARGQSVVAYSDLVVKVHAIPFEARDVRLDHLLGQISRDENGAGRGMLSVVVVHKQGDQWPGPGFFALGEELGYSVQDHDEFWISMLSKVYASWSDR